MPWNVPSPNALPGMQNLYVSQPRDIFYSEADKAQYFSPPPAIDGTASGNAANAPYSWLLWAGQVVGRETSSGKYATSIMGQSTASYTSGATSLTTDVNTAAELVRRVGTSGTFSLIGPPSAAGTVASATVTYSAVNLSTGVITVSNIGANYISGSWIGPTDGSQLSGGSSIYTLLAEINGVKVADVLNTTRVDAFTNRLWAGGGIINTSLIVNYPSDTSMITYLKTKIRAAVPGAAFSDDFTG